LSALALGPLCFLGCLLFDIPAMAKESENHPAGLLGRSSKGR
jgi:hypothetical protein